MPTVFFSRLQEAMATVVVPLAIAALEGHASNADVVEAALECLVAMSTSEHNRVRWRVVRWHVVHNVPAPGMRSDALSTRRPYVPCIPASPTDGPTPCDPPSVDGGGHTPHRA